MGEGVLTSLLSTGLRKYFRYSAVTAMAVALAVLPVGSGAWAGKGGAQGGNNQGNNQGGGQGGDNQGNDGGGAVRLLQTVSIPGTKANTTGGNMYVFDISFVDPSTQTYYLADRSNAVVDVVDATKGILAGQIAATPPFRGFLPCSPPAGANDCAGPNGVVAAFPWLFVTDAGSRVVTIDLRSGATVADVSTGGASGLRADELAYNGTVLLVVNNADTPPFATLISVNKSTGALTVGKRITLDAAHGVDATNGAEQPAWDPGTGKFYLSIPQIGASVKDGGVVRIDPGTGVVDKVFPVELCGPAGLSRGPGEEFLIGCNTVFDTAGNVWNPTGTVTAAPKDVILNVTTGSTTDVPGAGAGDEVWFNKGDGKYYATGSGSPLRPTSPPPLTAQGATALAVIDAESHNLVQLVPTFNVPAVTGGSNPHPAGTSHSVAANAQNNFVFVPLPANNVFPGCLTGCIAVYGRPSEQDNQGD